MKPIRKIKTKYYAKETLKYLLLAGAVYIATSSPYFVLRLSRNIFKNKDVPKKKLTSTFWYLKKKGFLEIKKRDRDVCISLTKEGKKRAGKYQIDDLYIERPKKWDGKWRLVIFDIPNSSHIIRDIFRRKLKEFGFYMFQRSVWIYPFKCQEEINFLREFLGANKQQIQVIEVSRLENDNFLRKIFKV
ncbi:MAG: CRISPR-associated endonuclease Cas2 [bacterium]